MSNLNVICGTCGDYFFGSLLSSLWDHFGDPFWTHKVTATTDSPIVLRGGNCKKLDQKCPKNVPQNECKSDR